MDNNEKDLIGFDYSILERQLRIQQQASMDTMTEVFATFGNGSPSNRPMSLKRLQYMMDTMEEGGLFFSTEMTRGDIEKRLGLHTHNEGSSCPLCDAGVPTKQKVLVAHEGNMISFDAETIEPCPTMPETFEGLQPGKVSIPDMSYARSAARQMGMTETYAAIMKQREPKGEQKPLRFNKRGKIIK